MLLQRVDFGSEWEMTCLGSHREENMALHLEVWPGDHRRKQKSGEKGLWVCVGTWQIGVCLFLTFFLPCIV